MKPLSARDLLCAGWVREEIAAGRRNDARCIAHVAMWRSESDPPDLEWDKAAFLDACGIASLDELWSWDNQPIQFRFALNQDVQIAPMKVSGRVVAREERPGGIHRYQVVYWCESKRYDEWMYQHELTEAK